MAGIAFWGLKTGQKQGRALFKRPYRKNLSEDYPYIETYVKFKKISNRLDARKKSERRPKGLKSSFKHSQ